jgi:hypothetical protein
MRKLGISGSLRTASSNSAALRAMACSRLLSSTLLSTMGLQACRISLRISIALRRLDVFHHRHDAFRTVADLVMKSYGPQPIKRSIFGHLHPAIEPIS